MYIMPTSESQKESNKKWRENNKDYVRGITRINATRFYYENRDEILEKKRIAYLDKKINNLDKQKEEILGETT